MKHQKDSRLLALTAACALLAAYALTGCGCMQSGTPTPTATPSPMASALPDSTPGSMADNLPGSMADSHSGSMLPEASTLPQSGSMAGSTVTGNSGAGSGTGMR